VDNTMKGRCSTRPAKRDQLARGEMEPSAAERLT
jgi:hypothetical protein